jgi:hypothetical protein
VIVNVSTHDHEKCKMVLFGVKFQCCSGLFCTFLYLSSCSCLLVYTVCLFLPVLVGDSVLNTFSPSSFGNWRTNPYPCMDIFLHYSSVDWRTVCQTVVLRPSFWSITRTTLKHITLRLYAVFSHVVNTNNK